MNKKGKMKEDEILFFHGYTSDNGAWRSKHHRITIAGNYKDVEGGRCLRLGISICEPNDQFTKKEGRNKATERLKNPNGLGNVEFHMRVPEGQELSYFNMFANIYQRLTSREIQELFGYKEMKAKAVVPA